MFGKNTHENRKVTEEFASLATDVCVLLKSALTRQFTGWVPRSFLAPYQCFLLPFVRSSMIMA